MKGENEERLRLTEGLPLSDSASNVLTEHVPHELTTVIEEGSVHFGTAMESLLRQETVRRIEIPPLVTSSPPTAALPDPSTPRVSSLPPLRNPSTATTTASTIVQFPTTTGPGSPTRAPDSARPLPAEPLTARAIAIDIPALEVEANRIRSQQPTATEVIGNVVRSIANAAINASPIKPADSGAPSLQDVTMLPPTTNNALYNNTVITMSGLAYDQGPRGNDAAGAVNGDCTKQHTALSVEVNSASRPSSPPLSFASPSGPGKYLHRRSGVIKLPQKVENLHQDSYQNKVQGVIDRAVYIDAEDKRTPMEVARDMLRSRAEEIAGSILMGFNATLRSSHTWVMMLLGFLSIYVCNSLGIAFPVEWGILSLGTVFPLSFSMSQSYSRRDTAASFVTALRVACISFVQLWNDYSKPETQENAHLINRFGHTSLVRPLRHKADVERVLVEMCNTIRLFLMHDQQGEPAPSKGAAFVRHVQRCIKTLYFLTDQAQMGRDGPAHFRAVSILSDITRAWDDLCRMRQYKPPVSLRYAAALFVHMAPFLLAPSFAKQECGARFTKLYGDVTCPAGYVGMFILVVVLMTLYKVERDLSNPFDQDNIDDLHFDISADLVDFYSLEIFALEAEDADQPQDGQVFPPPADAEAHAKAAPHLAVAIDIGEEGELPKIKSRRVKEEDVRDAIWEEGRRGFVQAAKLARTSVTHLNEMMTRATSPAPDRGRSMTKTKSIHHAGLGPGGGRETMGRHRKNKSWAGEAFDFLSPMSLSKSNSRNDLHNSGSSPERKAERELSLGLGHGHGALFERPHVHFRAPGNPGPGVVASSSDPELARTASAMAGGDLSNSQLSLAQMLEDPSDRGRPGSVLGDGGVSLSMVPYPTEEGHVHGGSLIRRLEGTASVRERPGSGSGGWGSGSVSRQDSGSVTPNKGHRKVKIAESHPEDKVPLPPAHRVPSPMHSGVERSAMSENNLPAGPRSILKPDGSSSNLNTLR